MATPYKGREGFSGLASGRVIDMAEFNRLAQSGAGGKKIARALSVPLVTAAKLKRGEHWQQDPEKVRKFNEWKGTSINPKTGILTPDDLVRFGGLESGEKRSNPVADEAARRLQALNDSEDGKRPVKIDTPLILSMIEERLVTALQMMDSTTVASMSPRDLNSMISMLTEKRNLLRGEPTAIVRNDQRGSLEKVGALLLAEMARRGIAIEGAESPMINIDGETPKTKH